MTRAPCPSAAITHRPYCARILAGMGLLRAGAGSTHQKIVLCRSHPYSVHARPVVVVTRD